MRDVGQGPQATELPLGNIMAPRQVAWTVMARLGPTSHMCHPFWTFTLHRNATFF